MQGMIEAVYLTFARLQKLRMETNSPKTQVTRDQNWDFPDLSPLYLINWSPGSVRFLPWSCHQCAALPAEQKPRQGSASQFCLRHPLGLPTASALLQANPLRWGRLGGCGGAAARRHRWWHLITCGEGLIRCEEGDSQLCRWEWRGRARPVGVWGLAELRVGRRKPQEGRKRTTEETSMNQTMTLKTSARRSASARSWSWYVTWRRNSRLV